MHRRSCSLLAALALAAPLTAQWPASFTSVPIASGWQQPVGIAFAPSGALFVWEKAGRVWSVVNGVKSAQPVIDIAEEVGDWRDHGLLGFALDPDFATNGRVYLGYVVDYHHLRWFGTQQYSPTTNQYFHDTIARVTRYELDPSTFALVHGSRSILLGESITTGIPITHQSHGMGTLAFGSDGSLLVSCGDGAGYEGVDAGGPVTGSSNTALADGILRPKEDVGAFRAQLVDSHSGKVLRLDPATGNGLSSNPYFDPAAPRAPRSRVWTLGLRNPFRMAVQPGTGSVDPQAGDPGTLWIGDVGWNAFEELDVVDGPGFNLGWPLHEGLEPMWTYQAQSTRNLDAPNPLFGSGGCTQEHFAFRDLLVQDTLATPSWPNPCNGSQQIPTTIPRFEHVRPLVDWGHGGTARARTWSGNSAAIAEVDSPTSPVQGPQWNGNSIIAGAWLAGGAYPSEYQGCYFFADFVGGWIRRFVPGAPAQVLPFATGAEIQGIVFLGQDPASGDLHFIRYAEFGASEVRRVLHGTNLPPIAVAAPAVSYGPAPLAVQFSSAGSSDPEGAPLEYSWDFGDGAASTLPHPLHVFQPIVDVTAQGTFIARVLELAPPGPQGGGNSDPEVLRDGDYPPVGSWDSSRQYDTFHFGDQGAFDWIGWSFPATKTFRGLVFQEGRHFFDGGWFDDWRVEVGDGATWTVVPGAVMTPAYPGNDGIDYQTFRISFPPAVGTRLRLAGDPGGSANFISAGELRVLAEDPSLQSTPVRRDVTLTVRDPLGSTSSTTVLVSLNNTPPAVSITSPANLSLYPLGAPVVLPLTASISDAEHAAGELSCAWQVSLHHDDHNHPEPLDPNCATSALITPEGCDGQEYYFQVTLTVTDAAGLAGSDAVRLYPDCAPVVLCAGDGSAGACPCGNIGAPGRGCENSFGTGGGRLQAAGSARLSNDLLALTASGLPPAGAALFFQGASAVGAGQGAPFGDGLLCATGDVRRLGVVTVSGGAAGLGGPGGTTLSVQGAIPPGGAVRVYQAWYRNSAPFCTSAAFNLTNGVRITWVP
ncbi:MAG: PQQ-dependent sugar dehydrogenase [Planctomycetes bacterium]|nr:PQQ-dependent sugar dehydrogenase [Planctomycetota bacterium]